MQETQRRRFNPQVRKIPWSRKWQPSAVFLPGKFLGQGSLVDYSPWEYKESDTTERLEHRASLYDFLYFHMFEILQSKS